MYKEIFQKASQKTLKRLIELEGPDDLLSYQCGNAQRMLFFALQNSDLDFTPFFTQSLENWHYGHAVGSVKIDDTYYVLDPTFIQYLSDIATKDTPANRLLESEVGQRILTDILKQTYFELTPQKAHTYLSCFIDNSSLDLTADDAFKAIITPKDTDFSACYLARNIEDTKQDLIRNNLYL